MLNGRSLPHGKTIGYVIISDELWTSCELCHGYDDPTNHILLRGDLFTLFRTRQAAERAIKSTQAQRPDFSGRIWPVAELRDEKHAGLKHKAKRESPKVLARTDLQSIESKMAEQVKRAKDNDPKELQKRIRELQVELAKKPATSPAPAKVQRVEVPALKDGQLARAEKLFEQVKSLNEAQAKRWNDLIDRGAALFNEKLWERLGESERALSEHLAGLRKAVAAATGPAEIKKPISIAPVRPQTRPVARRDAADGRKE